MPFNRSDNLSSHLWRISNLLLFFICFLITIFEGADGSIEWGESMATLISVV